jgi:hypothetical protein
MLQATPLEASTVWSSGTDPVPWTQDGPFPLSWTFQQSSAVFFDDLGVETDRLSLGQFVEPGREIIAMEGNDVGSLFAVRTMPDFAGLSEFERAGRLSKEGAGLIRLLLLRADGERVAEYQGDLSAVLSSEGALVYLKAPVMRLHGTIPVIVDRTGRRTAELPEALYWHAQGTGEAIYTWSFPSECCTGLLVYDVGGLPHVGTLAKWDWTGSKMWSVEVVREGRNPAQFAVVDGGVVLRYGHRWRTDALVAIDDRSGRVVAERSVHGEMTLMRGDGLWLVKRVEGDGIEVSLIDPRSLTETPFSYPFRTPPQQIEGPTAGERIALALVKAPSGVQKWVVLQEGTEPLLVGEEGVGKVIGEHILWSLDGRSRMVDAGRFVGGSQ